MSPYSLLDPAVNVADRFVVAVSHGLTWPGGGASVVAGVILLTALVRASTVPLSLRSFRANRARAVLAPELERLRHRHSKDRAKLAAETAQAYRRAGISPFAGLGSGLLQLPVVATVYRVVVVPTVAGHPNAVVTASLFGGSLSAHWPALLASGGLLTTAGLGFAAVVGSMTILAWLSSRQASRLAAVAPAGSGSSGSTGAARLARLLPYGTVVFAAVAPVGVSAYLLATTAWTVAERGLMVRFA
jgi:YidC/Oxa1 family membrane protein insertase